MGQTASSRADELFAEEPPLAMMTKSPSLNKLNEQLSDECTEPPSPIHLPVQTNPYKVVVYGDVGVGKTSLNRRLVGKPYQKLEKKTIGKNTFTCETEFFQRPFKFKITDFSGQRHFINISTMNAKDADVVIFVYDVTRKSTFVNISQWFQTVMENCKDRPEENKLVFLIVGNMTDQPSGRAVTTKEGEEFAAENGFIFAECSAKADSDLDKKILLMIAKQISDNYTSAKTGTQLAASHQQQDEWTFNALLRNDVSQTIPVLVVYSRRRSNLVIRKADQKPSKDKNAKDTFMGIELSTTKQMHYCMHSKTILILDNYDQEQRIIWTCNIVSSNVPFQDLIISLVFEAKVAMTEIAEFGSVSDVLTTYTKQCVLMKEIPSSIIVNQFQMMSSNTNLKLDLCNESFFQSSSKQQPRVLKISSLFESIKWTYGMVSILNLNGAALGDSGVEILCNCLKLQCIYQLRSLMLSKNDITDVGCAHLRKMFQSLSGLSLEQLDVSYNAAMKDQGTKKIVEVARSLSKLRLLDISHCGAGNDAASMLIEVVNSNRKLRLNLSNNNVTMAISDIILALPEDCLKMINFANNPIMLDTRISLVTTNNSAQSEAPPTKQTANKIIIDQSKVQIHRRIMNSVSTYTNPTFHAALKQSTKVPVEIRILNWAVEYSQRADGMKAVLQDLTTLSKVEHPNCVTYYGLYAPDSLTPPTSVNVIVENFGSTLSNYLYMAAFEFTSKQKVMIALEVAQGVQHLHSQNITHLNISSDTVMLTTDDNSTKAKISYYGLNRWLQRGYVQDFRNAIYQSPELLKSKGKTGGTMKSDVYAFSILLWELWYGKRPYELETLYYKDRKELLRQISDTGKRPHLPAIPADTNLPKHKSERRIQSLIHCCWQHDPTLRPDFKYINIALKDTLDSV